MNERVWNITSKIYNFLGPKNSWRIVMSPPMVFILKNVNKLIGKRYIIVRSKYGFFIKLKIEDYLISGHLHLGETNPYETKILRSLLKPGDSFFDVGAHLGWFTLNASQVVGPRGKVFAFEPNPDVSIWLQTNCELNHLKNVSIERLAVSDKPGVVTFWIGDIDSLGSMLRHNAQRDSKNKVRKIQTQAVSLDNFVAKRKLKKIKFIKIDAEGADLQVLKGSRNILRNWAPYLLVEVFGLTQQTDTNRDKNIIRYLSSFGYKPFELTDSGVRAIDKDNIESQLINVFFAKDEQKLKRTKLLTL